MQQITSNEQIVSRRTRAAIQFQEAIKNKTQICIDLGCGENIAENFIGIDARPLGGKVDVVWNLEEFPWPIPDDSCNIAIASHLVEHIKPWFTVDFFNEVWRILKIDTESADNKKSGNFCLITPYAGSRGFWQDPTHCNGFNEATFQYFDPRYPLWQIYKPHPWRIRDGFPSYELIGNLEVVLEKIEEQEDPEYYLKKGIAERLAKQQQFEEKVKNGRK